MIFGYLNQVGRNVAMASSHETPHGKPDSVQELLHKLNNASPRQGSSGHAASKIPSRSMSPAPFKRELNPGKLQSPNRLLKDTRPASASRPANGPGYSISNMKATKAGGLDSARTPPKPTANDRSQSVPHQHRYQPSPSQTIVKHMGHISRTQGVSGNNLRRS